MARKFSNPPPPPPPPPNPDCHLHHQGGEGVLCQDRRCSLGTKPDGTGHCKEINECFVEGWVYSQVHGAEFPAAFFVMEHNHLSRFGDRLRYMRSAYTMTESSTLLKIMQLCCKCPNPNQHLMSMFSKGCRSVVIHMKKGDTLQAS